tara:strand:- start:652 stop:2415 length:1764 start_codon:yes stop_codon:yes gene_type:complete
VRGLPTIELNHSTIEYIQRINGVNHDAESWSDWLPKIGCPVESNSESRIEIEVFPDRADLLSHEALAKASRCFFNGLEPKLSLDVNVSNIAIEVDETLSEIRPVVLAAVVSGVDTGSNDEEREDFIQSLMDHQEKLHLTLGRRRSFASIGVHDLASLRPPFKVTTVSDSYSFKPLAEEYEMTIKEILEEHPKGIEYAGLVSENDLYPVILDSEDSLVSFPPIINGSTTTVSKDTRDFFIDVTGWDQRACEACLLLVCLSLFERGGDVCSVKIAGCDGNEFTCPEGEGLVHRVPDQLLNKILGVEISEEDLALAIQRMGGRLIETRTVTDGENYARRWADCVVGDKEHIIAMPRWRSDIMHPIDIVEDVAIGYGFEKLPPISSSIHIDAIPLKSSNLKRRISESLMASGLQEVQSLTLSNEKDQFELMRWTAADSITSISNPITSEHTILRQFILPSLLRLLASNRHHELPQRVYELGAVVRDSSNYDRFAWASAEVGGGFSLAKGIVLGLFRDLGANLDMVEFLPTEKGHGPWIAGRGSLVKYSDHVVGEFGEVSPEVSYSFGIKSPINAGEFDVVALGSLISDPVT